MKVALFGAGIDGKNALKNIGKENVICFIDSYRKDPLMGVPVYSLNEAMEKIDLSEVPVIITSSSYEKEIRKKCREYKVPWFFKYYPMDHSKGSAEERLSVEEWDDLHVGTEDTIKEKVINDDVSEWTREMLRLTEPGDTVLEIGCGTGETSIYLAKFGRTVTATDYSEKTIEMIEHMAEDLKLDLKTVCCDATESLPFIEKYDWVFQAGLLEHFYRDQRVAMLRNWKNHAKKMVSLIPNACSLGYRVGKKMAEDEGTWNFGLEMPQKSLISEFEEAGITVLKEYTIDSKDSVRFLPKDHFLRMSLEKLMEENDLDDWGQGYLLVTIGECC